MSFALIGGLMVVLFAGLTLAGAFWAVSHRNLFRAALGLGAAFAGQVGLFVALRAEFVAFTHLLIYVGAVLILIVFAIMLTGREHVELPDFPLAYRAFAGFLSLCLFLGLSWALWQAPWAERFSDKPLTTAALGQQLVKTFMLPFEAISLVIVAAIAGVVVLAFRKEER